MCILCKSNVTYCKNMTSLFIHIECHHPDVYSKLIPAKKKGDLETGKSKAKQQVTILSCQHLIQRLHCKPCRGANKSIEEWKMQGKVVIVTTDNGSNKLSKM